MTRSWLVRTSARASARAKVLAQLWRYAAIGLFCAVLDFGIYHGLRALGLDMGVLTDLARGVSFLVGTFTAYFLNKRFTFAARGGMKQLGSFILLYGTVFIVAVGVNRWMLQWLPDSAWQSSIAWVISQVTASLINFVMLKYVVFRRADRRVDG